MPIKPTCYNALSTPPAQLGSTFDVFTKTFAELSDGWKEFGETGYSDPLKQNLQLAWNTSQTGAVDFTALAQASVSMIGLIPGAGPAIPFINMFIGFVFPKIFGVSTKEDNNKVFFDLIITEVKKIVDQSFQDFNINLLNNHLESIGDELLEFKKSTLLAIGKGDSPVLALLEEDGPITTPTVGLLDHVGIQFGITKSTIVDALPDFKNPMKLGDHAFQQSTVLLTLPMYTIAATLHLLLLQGYIQFASKWMDVRVGEDKKNSIAIIEQIKSDLQHAIIDYTSVITEAYNNWLPDLNVSDKNSINTYNRYVRSMKMKCFDIVSTWVALDNKNYYDKSTNFDKTRLLFSDVAGPWEGNNNIAANVIDIFTPVPGAVGFKESSDLRTFTYKKMELTAAKFNGTAFKQKSVEHGYCNGIQLQYDNNQTTISAWGNDSLTIAPSPMTYLNVSSQNSMYLDYSAVFADGKIVAGLAPIGTSASSINTALNNQKINAIYPIQSNNKCEKHADTYRKFGFMSSHVPYDLFPNNDIGDTDNKTGEALSTIKGFPFEKGKLKNGDMLYASEPINSAVAVKLIAGQEVLLPITNRLNLQYRMRIRYACNNDVNCKFYIVSNTTIIFKGQITLTKTIDLDTTPLTRMFVKGQFGKYVLMDLFKDPIKLPSGDITIGIENADNNEVFLDRIEIISVP
ncbi:insecticidal delta-endotoxin Cry8Ea1 family protein [Shewanella baltica]|uniref:insecticidal delta-endotoxin Cry8Ea1 family protein n=1 Tax=Shewanella baltica TaxID=62322 RepID=UPI00217E72B9|nr:insecticidal delta-endotoxin Cry8Ea1 family protein [Shewanella baltica]MCS6181403.1 hypothetical protein [Shewanella baltica]MCS6257664.1 hypothetical protein [Shewanella baltica]